MKIRLKVVRLALCTWPESLQISLMHLLKYSVVNALTNFVLSSMSIVLTFKSIYFFILTFDCLRFTIQMIQRYPHYIHKCCMFLVFKDCFVATLYNTESE